MELEGMNRLYGGMIVCFVKVVILEWFDSLH